MNCISATGRMPGIGRADRRADDRGFRDGRVDDALASEPVQQAFGHLEGAAESADVLPQDEDAVVARHLLREAGADRFEVGGLHHTSANGDLTSSRRGANGSSPAHTPRATPAGSGIGALSASCASSSA